MIRVRNARTPAPSWGSPTLTGLRVTGFLTNAARGGPGGQLADRELRHRRLARVEDRIRAAKDSGLRNLPFHDTGQCSAFREFSLGCTVVV